MIKEIIMITLTKIYEEITKKKTKETSPKSENNWTPQRCETYVLLKIHIQIAHISFQRLFIYADSSRGIFLMI